MIGLFKDIMGNNDFDGTLSNPGLMQWGKNNDGDKHRKSDASDDARDSDNDGADESAWKSLLESKCSSFTEEAPQPIEAQPDVAPKPGHADIDGVSGIEVPPKRVPSTLKAEQSKFNTPTEHADAPTSPAINPVIKSAPKSALAPPDATVLQAINYAATQAGVDPSCFYCLVKQESGFRTSVKASTSSATGLCQFVDQTWLTMIKTHGAECGLDKYADQLKSDGHGHIHATTPEAEREILALRNDPRISTMMGAKFAHDNQMYLQAHGIPQPNATDLYLAHFLGGKGAVTLIDGMKNAKPGVSAADLLPSAAGANHSIFYNRDGSARSAQEVYNHFREGAFSDKNMLAANEALKGSDIMVAANAAPKSANNPPRGLLASADIAPKTKQHGNSHVPAATTAIS